MHKQHNLPHAALLLALLAALSAVVSCDGAAVRLQLVHTDAGRGLSRLELLQRMAARTKARAARFLTGTGGSASAPVTPGEIQPQSSGVVPGVPYTEYLVHLGIGTPPQPVQLTLDTGSDLVWTQCKPCTVVCFPQSLPYFDPSLSSTFANCSFSDCSYRYGYADGSTTTGLAAVDTFTFPGGDTAVPGLLFGCGTNNTGIFTSNETGIAGFGRGNLSLPLQLNADNFSYCFTDITGAAPSPVLIGLPANLYSGGDPSAVQTTPLIDVPSSSAYFVSLTGISVGSTSVPVSTGVSTIVDSGTSVTSLPHDVYVAVLDAFVQQVSLHVHNSSTFPSQLCFTVPAPGDQPDVPKLMLQFDGATLDLPRESYMFEVEDDGVSVTCLALNDGGAGAASAIAIIGNYQQQNLHVLYDLANNTLSFVPAQCDQL